MNIIRIEKEILYVGINYTSTTCNRDTKEHACIIEEYK